MGMDTVDDNFLFWVVHIKFSQKQVYHSHGVDMRFFKFRSI